MRRHKLALLVVAVTAIALVATLSGTVAFANGQGSGAVVQQDFGCSLAASDSGLGVSLFTTDMTHEVDTPDGTTCLVCHFDIPEGEEPAKAIKNEGFPCGTFGGLTYDSKSVVTPGGKATLRCQIEPIID